jgi:sporulation protein YlmC with PRC-barrel domain
MDIPINAEVQCTNGLGGHTYCVLINPITQKVTHVVVREKGFPHIERLVPRQLIVETSPDAIRLGCTQHELAELESFTEVEYIHDDVPYWTYEADEYRMWPYVAPAFETIPIELERVPPGELTIHRGAQVIDKDDHRVGQVDEFLVDPANGHITHLVLREGHLWGQKDVTIAVGEIDRIEEDEVYLKLDKHTIERLPAIPIRRRK